MSLISSIEEYNKILNCTTDYTKHIKKLDEGTIITINGIWREYQNYFKCIDFTGETREIEDTKNNTP
mgnify:CR=1 FL=1|tara:strand:- start:1714 stop:1914 length:201 start_codon:yes stop_codon:yes gene_type:complete